MMGKRDFRLFLPYNAGYCGGPWDAKALKQPRLLNTEIAAKARKLRVRGFFIVFTLSLSVVRRHN